MLPYKSDQVELMPDLSLRFHEHLFVTPGLVALEETANEVDAEASPRLNLLLFRVFLYEHCLHQLNLMCDCIERRYYYGN